MGEKIGLKGCTGKLLVCLFLCATFLLGINLVCPSNGFAEETVRLKILAVNPSPTDQLKTTVTQTLPPEVVPEDIIDLGGMKVEYNKEKKSYELSQEVELAPRETKTIIVRVKNVWTLSDDELGKVRKQLDDSLAALQGTPYYETGKLLYTRLTDKLGQIELKKARNLSMKERIELYRAKKKELDEIRDQVSSVTALRRLKDEQTSGARTAKFIITAENQSNEDKTLMVKASLPKDVTPDGVIDKLDFDMLFDESVRRFYLQKEVDFKANETKKYEIILRDIWFIQQSDLDFLKTQTGKLLEHFKGTTYERYAANIGNSIYDSLTAVKTLQDEVAGSNLLEDRIRAFVVNTERVELVRKKLTELQDLLLEVPLKTNPSTIDQFKQAMKEFQKTLGKILSMGFQPNLATTWWIILGIIAFLFIMSTVFYVNWIVRLNEVTWAKKKSVAKKQAKEKSESTETKKEAENTSPNEESAKK